MKTPNKEKIDYKSWSLQYIFDIVVDHLRAQNKKCDNDFGCIYLGPDGLKCAAGFLIPDGKLTKYFISRYNEGMPVDDVPFFNKNFTDIQLDLIRRLQEIHDSAEISSWKKEFKKLAKDYRLVFSEKK